MLENKLRFFKSITIVAIFAAYSFSAFAMESDPEKLVDNPAWFSRAVRRCHPNSQFYPLAAMGRSGAIQPPSSSPTSEQPQDEDLFIEVE